MEVTIGGNRVGSGSKMKTDLNNYNRSTHNLNTVFASSMAPGILYPVYCKPALRGDVFEIDLDAACRTIPTKGPLFGSYKLQVDFFSCPVRLYQAILHNNPLAIGLKMSQVKLPKLKIVDKVHKDENGKILKECGKFANSSLIKYLGISGIGKPKDTLSEDAEFCRYIDAIPALAYYDIFKNYYANKQEENAYIITANQNDYAIYKDIGSMWYDKDDDNTTLQTSNFTNGTIKWNNIGNAVQIDLLYEVISGTASEKARNKIRIATRDYGNYPQFTGTLGEFLGRLDNNFSYQSSDARNIVIRLNSLTDHFRIDGRAIGFLAIEGTAWITSVSELQITPFELSEIDDMRYQILGNAQLGNTFIIDDGASYPYLALTECEIKTSNAFPLNGLVLKTYQNDLFNNWLNAEWIEGPGSIADLTKVGVENGAFTIDSFNLSTKLYNMLNRVAIAGNTFEDWQNVVYEEVARHQVESPVFLGGMSREIVFDEIIQTAPAGGDPLGTLGGRGNILSGSGKGGHINVKCDEACFIIGIASLTPRIYYTQSNEFYMTELDSMDDFHKPALDGIGFQDLIGERLAWFDTILNADGTIDHRSKVGKVPAWIEYMTDVPRAYGDFAETEGLGYMILNRNYEEDENGGIKDATTYIDPVKYNYAFAYSGLDAQNFWVQIQIQNKARRLMSARVIPNV